MVVERRDGDIWVAVAVWFVWRRVTSGALAVVVILVYF